jgi:hypothetical protein
MKKLLVIIFLSVLAVSCSKENAVIPQPDLTNFVPVRMDIWYAIHGPLKEEYYLDMGSEIPPQHFTPLMVANWATYQYWYFQRTMYVTKADYNTYL